MRRFFAPRCEYPPCGMFSVGHIVSLALCIAVLGVLLYLTRKQTEETFRRRLRVLAVVVTALEIAKIVYHMACGNGPYVNTWCPLYFCSLFIYALWMSGFGKGRVRAYGDAFLSGGCLLGGTAFLLFPTTSFTQYPLFHFLCVHSLFYHTAMLYVGLTFLARGFAKLDKQGYLRYALFIFAAGVVATAINLPTGGNMMMFHYPPEGLPFAFLTTVYEWNGVIYCVGAFLAHVTVPYLVSFGVDRLARAVHGRSAKTESEREDEETVLS